MSMKVKAYLIGKDNSYEEIRRFVVDQRELTNFTNLKRKVFEFVLCLGDSPFQMYYKDEEGDMIAFSSNDELSFGLGHVKDDTFRLFIKRANHDRDWNPAREFDDY